MSGWNPPPGQGGSPYGGDPNYGQQPGGYGQPGYGQQPPPPPGQQPGPPGGAPPPPGQPGQPGYGAPPPPPGQPGGPGAPPPPPGYGAPGAPPPPGQPYGMPGPVPPQRKSNTGLVIGLLGGGVALVLIVIAAVVVIAANSSGGDEYVISTPQSASGFTRDSAAEGRLGSGIENQRNQIEQALGGQVDDVKTAVYSRSSESYLFVGGTGDFGDTDSFKSDFERGVRSSAPSSVQVSVNDVQSGGDGPAVCATLSINAGTSTTQNAVCVWATSTSFGMVAPASQSPTQPQQADQNQVSSVMRDLRSAVESKK